MFFHVLTTGHHTEFKRHHLLLTVVCLHTFQTVYCIDIKQSINRLYNILMLFNATGSSSDREIVNEVLSKVSEEISRYVRGGVFLVMHSYMHTIIWCLLLLPKRVYSINFHSPKRVYYLLLSAWHPTFYIYMWSKTIFLQGI